MFFTFQKHLPDPPISLPPNFMFSLSLSLFHPLSLKNQTNNKQWWIEVHKQKQ